MHYVYAIIDSEKVVRQLGVKFEPDPEFFNMVARATYGEHAYAMDVSNFPVQEGDRWEDAKSCFVRGEEEIRPLPSVESEVERLQAELKEKEKTIAAQDENITALQMALVEIYEGGGEE